MKTILAALALAAGLAGFSAYAQEAETAAQNGAETTNQNGMMGEGGMKNMMSEMKPMMAACTEMMSAMADHMKSGDAPMSDSKG